MTHIEFSGVFPAMVTPFTADNQIDTETLRKDAQRLETAGVDGLVPVGSTGESATLSHAEHVEVIEAVVDAVEDVPVIAGTGSNNTAEALDLSQQAAAAGADALLLISPYYNKPEPEGMYDHYRQVADAVDLPQIVYNVPSRTGQNITVDTAVRLAEHENIRGYKAASGDLNQISEVIERTRDEDFSILSGDDGLTLPILSIGGHGAISVVANVEPKRACAMVGAALEGDYAFGRAIHHELGPLTRHLFVETNPIPVKTAMAMRGYTPERIRSPLTPLSDEHRPKLERLLTELDGDVDVDTDPTDVDEEDTE